MTNKTWQIVVPTTGREMIACKRTNKAKDDMKKEIEKY